MEKVQGKSPVWINTVSDWLDSKFTIPYTNIKFGLDPIFSLFPIVGDLVTYLVSLLIIVTINRNGVSGELLLRMLINSSVDAIIGAIPLVGTVFDVGYKSNTRNLKLLKTYYEDNKYQGDGKVILTLVVLLVLAILIGLIYLTYFIIKEGIVYINQL